LHEQNRSKQTKIAKLFQSAAEAETKCPLLLKADIEMRPKSDLFNSLSQKADSNQFA